jgi:hypothetical protein
MLGNLIHHRSADPNIPLTENAKQINYYTALNKA